MDPARVIDICRRVMPGGANIVFDRRKSRGSVLHDALSGRDYIDCFSFFASQALSHNHPDFDDPDFEHRLLFAAKYKPANPDMYSEELARGIERFRGILPPRYRQNLFFIAGGSAAVENAFKAAMDAKVRQNLEAGRGELGTRIIHFEGAFHGRGGYTLSVTNTDPEKVKYFAKFDWPRVSTPYRTFPETGAALEAVKQAEARSLEQIRAAVAADPHGIAGLVIEPIQGEGGDRHFRPEFLRALRGVCDECGIYLIADEVQCGMGISGSWWVSDSVGMAPDLMVFGKKAQVCGVAARDDFRAGKDSVFSVPSRINSTWGGNIVDYVRLAHIIGVIERHDYLQNVRQQGQALQQGLARLQEAFPTLISNPRGMGLFCAFDVSDSGRRDMMLKALLDHGRAEGKPGVYLMPRGSRSIGFRPYLDVDSATIDYVLGAIGAVATRLVRSSDTNN